MLRQRPETPEIREKSDGTKVKAVINQTYETGENAIFRESPKSIQYDRKRGTLKWCYNQVDMEFLERSLIHLGPPWL